MQTSTVLPLMSFSHSKIQLEIAFSCPVPLGLLQYRTISWSFFFVFHDHDTLKSSSLVFCRFPSVCLMFPMKLYFVGKPSHRWWYHLIIAGSTWHWHGQLEMLTLITGLRWCLQISSPQLLCFSFIFSSSKVSYWVQPTVKGGRIKLPLLEGVKNLQAMWETWVQSLVGKIPWRRAWQPTPVCLPGEPHGQRSLVGYSPWGHRVGHNWATKHSTAQT